MYLEVRNTGPESDELLILVRAPARKSGDEWKRDPVLVRANRVLWDQYSGHGSSDDMDDDETRHERGVMLALRTLIETGKIMDIGSPSDIDLVEVAKDKFEHEFRLVVRPKS